jgi:5-methylcytosine-specific restriction protein A
MTKPRIPMATPRIAMARPRIAPLSRPDAPTRGYDGARVKAARVFKAVHPHCLGCKAVGLIVATQVVDHVEPHKGDRVKFWNQARWQPACRWHHDRIKPRLEGMFACGSIGIDQLWLDSATAIGMTRDAGRG